MPRTTVNGVDLYYERHGTGEPLMLISGLASDSQSWLPVVERLAQDHLVILPDNRGAGRTTPQEIQTSIRHIADDSMALAEHLGLSSVTLVGHSMGGFVALDCASRHPHRVSRLILSSTSAINSARNNALFRDWASYLNAGMDKELWFRNLFYWIFSKRFFEDQSALSEAIQLAIEYPYPQSDLAFERQVRAIAEFDSRRLLPNIQQPTLILCGKEDQLFPPEESLSVLQALPNATDSVIDDAAHSLPLENPRAFADCVLSFTECR